MKRVTGKPGRWTSCRGSELDSAPAEPGWSCSVVISFSGTSLLFWLQHANALRFVLASSPDLSLKLWIKEENERSAISQEFWRWGGKELNWFLLAWVLSLTKEDLEQRIGSLLEITSLISFFSFLFQAICFYVYLYGAHCICVRYNMMSVFQVKTSWHVRSAGLWQRFTSASSKASAWATWTPRETGATPETT